MVTEQGHLARPHKTGPLAALIRSLLASSRVVNASSGRVSSIRASLARAVLVRSGFRCLRIPLSVASLLVSVQVNGAVNHLTISHIQGKGYQSAHTGRRVATTGVVIGDFQGVPDSDHFHPKQLSGFFIQDPEGDGDARTSDGIFIFCGDACTSAPVSVGDIVTASGVVEEGIGPTRINVSDGGLLKVIGKRPLPKPTPIELPLDKVSDLQAYESMLVSFDGTLSVADYFALGRYGEVLLYKGERPFQFTHNNSPDVQRYQEYEAALALRRIILDDDANGDNQALAHGLSVFHPIPGLSVNNYLRGGDTISDLTGVLDFGFGEYRLRPVVEKYDYRFQRNNPRISGPDRVGGTLQVASINLDNYFPTIDVTPGRSEGDCGPAAKIDCRGADSQDEFFRQTQKIVAAVCAINTDIVALSEIENDPSGNASLELLIDALDKQCPGYDYVDAGPMGTDAIKAALLFRGESVVAVEGLQYVIDDVVDSTYRYDKNRPTLVQVFEERATRERLVVAAHHLKSKGSDCAEYEDESIIDGQSSCSETRANAARIIVRFINNTVIPNAGTDRVLVAGDLNAYKQETTVQVYKEQGYVDLVEAVSGSNAYSYVYDGKLGYMDYMLGLNLLPHVTGVTEWHINADEVSLLDYNDKILDRGEPPYEQKPGNRSLFRGNVYRFSDHDPVLIGLDLAGSGSIGPTIKNLPDERGPE